MTWWWRGAGLVLAFLVAAVAMFPLRMAWDAAQGPAELPVGDANGTIWSGQLRNVEWRGVALGDFEASLSPLDLLPSPALRLTNGSGPLKSAMLRSDGDGFAISQAVIRLALADVVTGAPPNLSATITNGEVSLRSGRCTHAAGLIESPPALGRPAFAGALTCDRGALLARLKSDAGDVVLEISPALAYRTASPALQLVLAALGIPAARPVT